MDRKEYLDFLIADLRGLTKDENAVIFHDIMCDALIWSDETVRGLGVNEMGCLRGIFRYRTSLIIQEKDPRIESLWNELKVKYPEWIGFDPARCSPNEALAAQYREIKKKSPL